MTFIIGDRVKVRDVVPIGLRGMKGKIGKVVSIDLTLEYPVRVVFTNRCSSDKFVKVSEYAVFKENELEKA